MLGIRCWVRIRQGHRLPVFDVNRGDIDGLSPPSVAPNCLPPQWGESLSMAYLSHVLLFAKCRSVPSIHIIQDDVQFSFASHSIQHTLLQQGYSAPASPSVIRIPLNGLLLLLLSCSKPSFIYSSNLAFHSSRQRESAGRFSETSSAAQRMRRRSR